MSRVVWDEFERVGAWVAERVQADTFGAFTAIGLERDGELIAGVVYHLYTGPDIAMHIALNPGVRLTRQHLAIAFGYPFHQLQCKRITGMVRADNSAAQRFDEHLGFVREGLKRQATQDGCDVIVYGMLREECRWLDPIKLDAPNESFRPTTRTRPAVRLPADGLPEIPRT